MALTAGTLWEIRSGGNDLNGAGFYNRDPGTSVDYSDQDAAQADFTNLTTSGAASTTLTDGDAGGLFTAAMAGNLIYIASGTNFTAGYYEIVTFTDGDNVVLDRSPTPAAAGSSGAGKVGGGRATITDAFLEGVSVSDTVWLESGTYTPGENISVTKAGAKDTPIQFLGYQSTRGDDPTGDNRPLIQSGAFDWKLGAYWIQKNWRMTISDIAGCQLPSYSIAANCKVTQAALGASYCFDMQGVQNVLVLDCEAESSYDPAKSTGFETSGCEGARVISCYAHNLATGIYQADTVTIDGNIIADCEIGIDIDFMGGVIRNNTIVNCGIGIDGQHINAYNALILNNIIAHCTDGAKWTNSYPLQLTDYNNWYGNTTDVTNFAKGSNATAVDPAFDGADFEKGTTATTSSSVLTDGGADFSAVTDNQDFCRIVSGTGVTPGIYLITAHTGTSVTLAADPGDSAAGDIVYTVGVGHDYSLSGGSGCIGAGFSIRLGVS